MRCIRGAVLPFWAAGLIVAGIVFNQRPIADATDVTKADAVHNIRRFPRHREVPNDPWMPRPSKAPAAAIGHCGPWERGPFKSFQVNVNKIGCNIVGDAANEPSIAIDPTDPNRLVIGWRQFDSVESDFRQAGWGYSHDGGQAWTFPGVLEPGVFRSDPVLDADADGNIYFYSLTGDFTCDLYKSVDGGLSWLKPVSAFGGDKAWMAIDRTDGIGRGNIYASWSVDFSCCFGIFTRSTDGGSSFMVSVELPREPKWGTIAVGPEGEVYITGCPQFGFPVVLKSTNARDPTAAPSFSQILVAPTGSCPGFLGGSPNPGGLLGQVWVATDHPNARTRGNVYFLTSGNSVAFMRSADGGSTWSVPIRVNDDPENNGAWHWFGTMSVAPNGRIDVVWNDTRASGEPNLNELFYAFSVDPGAT
ncbi:MAG: hypothetical protein IIC01_03570, partial [Planctomycetes bacterium]|nr:hypothetical protein [Planctomycetota bacterium]